MITTQDGSSLTCMTIIQSIRLANKVRNLVSLLLWSLTSMHFLGVLLYTQDIFKFTFNKIFLITGSSWSIKGKTKYSKTLLIQNSII
jgi:hypothetical protein